MDYKVLGLATFNSLPSLKDNSSEVKFRAVFISKHKKMLHFLPSFSGAWCCLKPNSICFLKSYSRVCLSKPAILTWNTASGRIYHILLR